MVGTSLKAPVLLILAGLVSYGQGYQAEFFDDTNFQGNSFTLSISGDCYNFKDKWNHRVSSVQIQDGNCLTAWDDEECRQRSIELTPHAKGINDLAILNFDKRMRSVSLCSDVKFHPIIISDRMSADPNEDMEQFSAPGNDEDEYSDQKTQEINFYDEANFSGSTFTLTSSGACYTFKSKWMDRISSIDTQGKCIIVWNNPNCKGSSVKLPSSKQREDLKVVNFDKQTESVRLCSQAEAGEGDARDGKRIPNRNNNASRKENLDLDADIMDIALKEHNKYRRAHGVPTLNGDETLRRLAQKHADYLAQNNKFQHSSNDQYGENIAGISTRNKVAALKDAIRKWYEEIEKYDFDNPRHSVIELKAGHFTAMVWKITTHLGIGMAWNPRRRWWVIVANYNPPGNFKGQYGRNVLPPTGRY